MYVTGRSSPPSISLIGRWYGKPVKAAIVHTESNIHDLSLLWCYLECTNNNQPPLKYFQVKDLVWMHVLFYKSCEGQNIVAHLLNQLILAEGSTYFQHVDDHTNTKVITSPVNVGVIVSNGRFFHLSSLLASTDLDVVEACLQTLLAFLRKSIENVSDPIALELGSTLHFEFYADNESLRENSDERATQGLQIIHLLEINTYEETDLELLHNFSILLYNPLPILLDNEWGSKQVLKDDEALCLDAIDYGNVARCFDSNLIDIPVEVETPDHNYYHDYGIDFEDKEHPIKVRTTSQIKWNGSIEFVIVKEAEMATKKLEKKKTILKENDKKIDRVAAIDKLSVTTKLSCKPDEVAAPCAGGYGNLRVNAMANTTPLVTTVTKPAINPEELIPHLGLISRNSTKNTMRTFYQSSWRKFTMTDEKMSILGWILEKALEKE
nr:probable inactive histone-lysine N-methyltransferase SUVR2 isoform X1 [Tanacetum cinerariifolium]